MKQNIIFMTVLLLLEMATAARNACSDPRTFGDNCEYQCHCAGGQACGSDGSCSNGCASGWEGEYCQLGNVAAGKSSSTSQSSTNDSYHASLALDDNTNQAFFSCSHTNTEDQPWWQVDLGREYVLFNVKVVNANGGDVRECKNTKEGADYRGTISTTRPDPNAGGKVYTCQSWYCTCPHKPWRTPPSGSSNYCRNPEKDSDPWCYTIDERKRFFYCDVPFCQAKLKNFKIFMGNNLCHHYTGAVGFSYAKDIMCDAPVVGRHLKIQLMDSSTVLTLCEVSVKAFQYKACRDKHYGPNCNNRCQCANDVTCDEKTGKCPSGLCNDHFTGPYCNIGLPSVSKDGPSTPTSISVKWRYDRPHDGAYDAVTVERLELRYGVTGGSTMSGHQISSPKPGTMRRNVTDLKPSTQYSFHVKVTYRTLSKGKVATGSTAILKTASCAVPSAPEITILAVSLTTVTVLLTPPDPPYGVITRYTIEIQKDGGNPTMAEISPINPSPTIDKLQSRTLYSFKARAWTSKGAGAWSKVISVITEENIPGPPRTITMGKHSATTLLLNWIPPKYNNGRLMTFKVTCIPIFSYDPDVNSDRVKNVIKFNPGPDTTRLEVTGLSPATEYNCSIAAQTSKGYGPSVWSQAWTAPEKAILPENLFFDVSLDETTDTSVTVVMKTMPKSLKYGFISKVRVGVEKLSNTRRKRSAPLTTDEYSLLTDYKTAKGNGYRSYIAAELDANYSGPFVIGDGKTYGGYFNPPLETGQKYDVLFGIVFKAGEIETTSYRRYGKAISVKGSSSVALAVGLTVGLLVVLAAIIVPVAIVIRRRKQTEESSPGHINEEPMRMESRRRDLPDALGVGETNLACTVDQQEDTVYEVIQTNVEKSELSGVGTSSGGNTSTGVRPKDATQGATEEITSSIYAYAEAFPRVAVDNIYEIAVADKHDYEQTTYEALDEARMAEPGVGTSAGGYKEPRCGPSVTTKEVVNTNAAADIGDAAASDAFEGQEKENIYQNTGESLCITQASGAYENVGFSP